ncbi:hypothetical protein I6A81_11830 [Frankia sp. CN7]|uniref:Uncharacterized protein n=1 Tax=Frankia nepalensis TaxID=1836974 RepID=A0A937R5I9_9ACTN|nr:hypothetical protein [Frankia nepalensis]MBL7496934.1 hypothetical protein [Frankia nepalensis]MBL7626133.1 hypothetical protein [Frankia nepalensis]
MADSDAPVTPPALCGLCGHPWSTHFGGGPTAVWVTCCAAPGEGGAAAVADEGGSGPVAGLGGPVPTCYCRRAVDEFRAEALAAAGRSGGAVVCVTCGAAPAQDTQCRACRDARQRARRARFAARQAQLARDARRRGR